MLAKGELKIIGYPVKSALYENGHFPKSRKELKDKLLETHKTCYWCGITVKVYPFVEGVTNPKDEATIDHLKASFRRKQHEWVERVIACSGCNIERSKLQKKRMLP